MTEESAELEIFVKDGCPYCAALRRTLQRKSTSFVEHNVQRDPEALQRMLDLNGGRRNVPTILRGGEVTVGFRGM